MKAGIEMDILVAEKVMDWEQRICEFIGIPMWSHITGIECAASRTFFETAIAYSTDIALAWQVVEKVSHLKVSDDTIQPAFQVMANPYDDVYYAGWSSLGSNTYHWTYGKTAPEAICLAALAAKGITLDIPAPVAS